MRSKAFKKKAQLMREASFVTEVSVVDTHGKPVPKDGSTSGEIIIKSEANMVGYWQKPDLTAETI